MIQNAGRRLTHLPVIDAGSALRAATEGAHRAIDRDLKLHLDVLVAKGSVVPCRKGCSACCFYPVDVQILDAWLIAAHVRRWPAAEQGALRRRLTHALSLAQRADVDLTCVHASPEKRKRYLEARIACPFLVADACSIYEVRPTACRTHVLVDRDPAECAKLKNAEGFWSLDSRPLVEKFFRLTRAAYAELRGAELSVGVFGTGNLLLLLEAAWELVARPDLPIEAWLRRPVLKAVLERFVEDVRGLQGVVGDGRSAAGAERAHQRR